MYNKLNINENSLKTISLFSQGYDESFHIRQLAGIIGISVRTAQIILNYLEDKSILTSSFVGKSKIYKLNKNTISYNYILLAEQYKKIGFLESNQLIGEVCDKLAFFTKGSIIVFGSYAKDNADDKSDLDIFVIGEIDRKRIKEISETYNIEINPKIYSLEDIDKRKPKDFLIREVLDNHIIIKGGETFLDIVFDGR